MLNQNGPVLTGIPDSVTSDDGRTAHRNGTSSTDLLARGPSVETGEFPGPPASPPLVHVRWYRVLGALGALLVAGAVIVRWMILPSVFPISDEARITGPMSLVKSSVDGTATLAELDSNAEIRAGQLLGVVDASVTPDDTNLRALLKRRDEQAARRERLIREREVVARFEQEARVESRAYREASLESLEATLREAQARLDARRVEERSARRELEVSRRLFSRGVLSRNNLQAALARAAVAAHLLAQDGAAMERSQAELRAVERGVFVQKDTPYFVQLAEGMANRGAVLDLEISENREVEKAAEVELRAALDRVGRQSRAEIRSPASGILIRRLASGHVSRGDPLFEIGHGRQIFVEALVDQTHLRSLSPGSRAVIAVTGGPTLPGRVRSFRLTGPTEVEPTVTAKLPRRPDQVSVLIDLDDPSAGAHADLYNKHCRVLILQRPGIAANLAAGLFSWLR